MNERYRFRVWNLLEQRWEEGLSLGMGGLLLVCTDCQAHQHEWYIVEFATGYQDKHGQMIYDGDIVKHWEYGDEEQPAALRRVVWGHVSDCCIEGDMYVVKPYLHRGSVWEQAEYCEVIGNIHEHAYLLGEEESIGKEREAQE